MPFSNGLPKYRELKQSDKQLLIDAGILNGCGPETWRGPRPDWLYKADCYEHDYNYIAGGSEADRRWADWGFYTAMIKDSKRVSWWAQFYARFKAWLFYRLVRRYGRSQYNYTSQQNPGPATVQEILEKHSV